MAEQSPHTSIDNSDEAVFDQLKVPQAHPKLTPAAQKYLDDLIHSAELIKQKFGEIPPVVITLGSGLGEFVKRLENPQVVPYAEVEFPQPTVKDHAGNLVKAEIDGVPVLVMQGRVHLYEDLTPAQVSFSVRALAFAGVKALIVTNSAGGISKEFAKEDLMQITDHINWTREDPSSGVYSPELGLRYHDMSQAYDIDFQNIANQTAQQMGVNLKHGIYLMVPGSSYETPAEIHAFSSLGAHAVGMSTVIEVIAARQMDLRVAGFSVISNPAAGNSLEHIDGDDVNAVGRKAIDRYSNYLREVMVRITAEVKADAEADAIKQIETIEKTEE